MKGPRQSWAAILQHACERERERRLQPTTIAGLGVARHITCSFSHTGSFPKHREPSSACAPCGRATSRLCCLWACPRSRSACPSALAQPVKLSHPGVRLRIHASVHNRLLRTPLRSTCALLCHLFLLPTGAWLQCYLVPLSDGIPQPNSTTIDPLPFPTLGVLATARRRCLAHLNPTTPNLTLRQLFLLPALPPPLVNFPSLSSSLSSS